MANRKKETLLLWDKLLCLQDWRPKQFGNWLTTRLSYAIEHLPDKEELIYKVFKQCVVLIFLIKTNKGVKNKILSMLEYPLKNNWTTFLDKLNILDNQDTLSMFLFKTLVQELTLREKACRPFWTPVYKTISEKLLLPTEIDSVDSASILSNCWSPKQVVKSQFLTIQKTKLANKNLQKTFFPSFMSSHADKWENEAMQQGKKTIKLKIFPTSQQKKHLDEFIDTSRYVYNKALEHIKNGHRVNFMEIRDLLVTENTKKGYDYYIQKKKEIEQIKLQKNDNNTDDINSQVKEHYKNLRLQMKSYDAIKNPKIQDFETRTPKDIRSNAIKSLCDAFKSGFTNLKHGNIKYFNMKFKKKNESSKVIELTPKNISMKDGVIKILPETFGNNCILKISHKNKIKHKQMTIQNNVDIIKTHNNYYIYIVCNDKVSEEKNKTNIASVDPGLRTLGTVYTISKDETTITEYIHRKDLLMKLNKRIDMLKDTKIYFRKKQYNKIELKKTNIIDATHWEFINDLLKNNDIIYFGDIKSHNIVKGNKNHTLNRLFNDAKLYLLKQRLMGKALKLNKVVIFINESYTTKTCSTCGQINNNVGSKEIFQCPCCHFTTGRDFNASKNILMKGLLT